MGEQESLFKTKIVPGKPGTGNMFDEEFVYDDGPVTCLGMEFENDKARRDHFTELLSEKLKDSEYRKIEGFPMGKDEDILALSDPPYYTACPNPWINDFIAEWEAKKPEQKDGSEYHREPFASDVSEGKNDPIYNAHSYHTKVPHKAIMRYILHYTEPGDIIFDGFCGTGMTGVAAQMCGDRNVVMSLGYQVRSDGTILKEETDDDGKKVWQPFSKLGDRKAILNDLSPLAGHISHGYSKLGQLSKKIEKLRSILHEQEALFDDFYTVNGKKVLNGIWSDLFLCPECGEEIVFWNTAIIKEKIQKFFPCPRCDCRLGKSTSKKDESIKLERAYTTIYDPIVRDTVKTPKFELVAETVKYDKKRVRVEPTTDRKEFIEQLAESYLDNVPLYSFERGRQTNKLINGSGIRFVHQMYSHRALAIYSHLWSLKTGDNSVDSLLKFCLSSINNYISRKQGYFGGGGGVAGTLFTPSVHLERNIFDVLHRKLNKLSIPNYGGFSAITCQSATSISKNAGHEFDYIFIDPPFGENFQYAELNSFVEAWLKVKTDTAADCVMNYVHQKGLLFYSSLMKQSFDNFYRVLKPGRWITIEFSNTQASVWNSIQAAIQAAGFVVANISALDKKQGSFNAVTNTTSVKQDLVISAYKPNGGFENRFEQKATTEEGVWDFIRTHLKYLPVIKKQNLELVFIPERSPRILYDQMITYYVRKGYNVPIDSQDFQLGLTQRFSERDGMYFLPEQAAEYDRKKIIGGGKPVQQKLFISDEASAIEWLRNLLREKPQSSQDINPQFMKEISGWSKNEVGLELATLLEQNFICHDGNGPVPEQIHSYLSTNWKDMRNLEKDDPALIAKAKDRWYVPDPNKAGDLEKLREKALLKEFEEYKQTKKKLKIFRLEAVRAGFKKAWQEKDYAVIVAVAEKIPNKILEEDPKLLMWYDQSVTRIGGE